MRPRSVLPAVLAAAAVVLPTGLAAARESPGATDRDPRPVVAPERDRPHDLERLRLACAPRITDAGAAVGCEWSAPTSPRAAGVRLLRLGPTDDHRRVVFRTADLHVTSFTDGPLRPGRYAYAVQAVSSNGTIVGRSETVRVLVPEPHGVEVLRLACHLGPAHEAIGCEWSRPTSRDADVITLWRSVDGGPREVVERFRPSGPNAYRDPVPQGASKVTYAVIATSPDDRIVARSRAETVRLPDDRVRPTDARTKRERGIR